MCMCVATALYEYGTSVSVPVKMTCLSAGSCLLRVRVCVVVLHNIIIYSENGLHDICVY